MHAVSSTVEGRRIGAREVALVAAGGAALAVAMTWPLVLHLGAGIGKDLGDPLLQTWQVAWIGHALLEQPRDLWQANTFWPYSNTLAFTDALIGYAPAGFAAQSSLHAALVVYNLLFLFAYALAFLGAYLLARELGTGVLGGLAAGAAFAYAPWRLAQNGHLHVISSGGIALALFLLVRGYRRGSARLVIAGWLVAAWQMTLGFALGLQLAYLLAVLAVVGVILWVVAGRPSPSRALVAASALGIVVFVAASLFQSRPYLSVVDEFPEARRTPAYVESFSPELRSFLSAPAQSWLWDDASHRARAPLPAPDEQALFPGLTISLLALAGVLGSVYSAWLRSGLALGVVLCAALSLGVRDVSGLEAYMTPYRVLYELAPGWDGVRTPGRIHTLTTLGLALLAGAGLCVVRRYVRGKLSAAWAPAAGALLVAAVLAEGLGPLVVNTVPTMPPGQRLADEPQLHLPAGFHDDLLYSYWSVAGFPRMVNGAGGFDPNEYDRLRKTMSAFPDARTVSLLRERGVRTVVFHPERAAGTGWAAVADRPVTGLPLQREDVGGVVLYRLDTGG